MASYRDVAARGTPHSSLPTMVGNGSSGAFDPALPSRDVLSSVVASVLAVLAGRGQQQQNFCA